MNIFSIYITTSPVKNILCISTAQSELGLRSRTVSLKIIKLPTFSEFHSRVAVFKDCVNIVR